MLLKVGSSKKLRQPYQYNPVLLFLLFAGLSCGVSNFSVIVPEALLVLPCQAADALSNGFIGVRIGSRTGQGIIILDVMSDSPAAKAGLQINDLIVSINNQPTTNMGENEAAISLKGPHGTPVKVQVSRNRVLKDYTIIRDAGYDFGDYYTSAASIRQSVQDERKRALDNQKGTETQNSAQSVPPYQRTLPYILRQIHMSNKSYLGWRWNSLTSKIISLQGLADLRVLFGTSIVSSGMKQDEEVAQTTIPVLYATIESVVLGNRSEFQKNLSKLTVLCKRLPPSDRLAIAEYINQLNNNRLMVLGEYNKSVDATTLLMFSANLLASNRATANDEVLRDKNRNVLIDSLVAQSRFVEAEALAQEDIKEARVSNSRALIKSLDRLAKIYKTQQKYAQAEILTKEMLGQMITLNGASSLNIVGVHCELACLALYQKKISAADAECAIINKIMRDAIAAQPPDKTSIPIRGVYSGTEQLCGDMTRLAQSYENLGPSGNPLNTPRHLRAREREWESRSRRSSTNVKPSWVNALELENNAYRYNLSEVGLNLHAVSMLEYMQRLYVKADRGQELLPLYKEALDLSSRNKIEGSFRNAEQRELEAQRITNSLKSQQEKLVTYLSDISAVLPDTASEVPVEDDLRRRHLDLVRGNREPNFRAPALRSAREQYSLEQQRAKERQLSEQAKNIRVRENTQNEFQENLENSTKHVAELKAQHPVDSVKLAMALLDLSQTYGFASNGNNSRNGLDAIARFAEAVELYKNMQSDNSLMVNDALWRHAKMLASLDIDISPPVIELIALTELRLGEAYTKYSEFSRTWYSNSAARTKVSAAEKIAIAMVNDQRKYHPSDKERIISVLGSLAHAQACINNISGQEATYAEILKESQGMPNLRTNALRNACNFYLKIGNYEKFRTLWNELVQLSVKSDEVSRTSALYDLVLASSKNVELADTLIRQCIPIYFMSNPKSINGTYSFIQAINVVAYNYAERARFAQAESLLELALTSEEKAIGLDVIGTNELRILLSRILLKHYAWCHSHNDGVQGKKALTKSQSVFNTALRYAIKFNGTNSPAVNRMLKDRVDALTKCGLTREAQTVSAF